MPRNTATGGARYALLAASLLLLLIVPLRTEGETAVPSRTIFDFSRHDFRNGGTASLEGNWEFYWKRFVTTDQFGKGNDPVPDGAMRVPGPWVRGVLNGVPVEPFGFASYRATFRVPAAGPLLGIHIPFITAASRFYCNGKEFSIGGVVADNQRRCRPRHLQTVLMLPADLLRNDRNEIIVHLANFFHHQPGFLEAPVLGAYEDLIGAERRETRIQLFICGAIIIMGVYHLGLFLFRRRERSTLYFALTCFCSSMYLCAMSRDATLYALVPGMNAETWWFFFFFGWYGAILFLLFYTFFIFAGIGWKRLDDTLVVLCGAGVVTLFFFPLRWYFRGAPVMQTAQAVALVYCIVLAARGMLRRVPGAAIYIGGFLIIGVAVIHDILVSEQVIRGMFLASFGVLLFILAQSLLLAQRFSRAFAMTEELSGKLESANVQLTDLNRNLEGKVADRTIELQAAMEEMTAMNEELIDARDRLWGEMELARKIQTVLLPENPAIKGYDIVAYSRPANEVGGDYYDIINIGDRDWIVIGDVSGHGVPAGLVMMMAQTAILTVLTDPAVTGPREILQRINGVITRNVRRMRDDKYMTITVLACYRDGRFHFAGLHQNILVYRAATRTVDVVETNGAWLGLFDDIGGMLEEDSLSIAPGDCILLYTDGITEARDAAASSLPDGEGIVMFGDERLITLLREHGDGEPAVVRDHILAALEPYRIFDDITMVILKRVRE